MPEQIQHLYHSNAPPCRRSSRNSQILDQLISTLQGMDVDAGDPIELSAPPDDVFLGFGIFDSTNLAKCKRMVSKDDDQDDDEEDDSDSDWEEEFLPVTPPPRVAATRRRSGIRRGSYLSSPITIPTSFGSDSDSSEHSSMSYASSTGDNSVQMPQKQNDRGPARAA